MSVYQEENFFVFVPELPTDVYVNCSWGQFSTEPASKFKNDKLSAKEGGALKGDKASFALAMVEEKYLKFPQDKEGSKRSHVWAIPVGGELKAQFNEKASELINFVIKGISAEQLAKVLTEIQKTAFNNWLAQGAKGNFEEQQTALMADAFHSVIFDVEFVFRESNGNKYYFLDWKVRQPKTPIEKLAVKIAKRLHDNNLQGFSHPRLEENQMKALGGLSPQKALEGEV